MARRSKKDDEDPMDAGTHSLAPDIEERRQLSTNVFHRVQKVEGKWKVASETKPGFSGESEKRSNLN